MKIKNKFILESRQSKNDIETESTFTNISNGCLTSIRTVGTTYTGDELLLCKCTCGNEVTRLKSDVIRVKHRFCCKYCGNRKIVLKDDWSHKIRATLAVGDILERKEIKHNNVRYTCNTYKCICIKCGKEYIFSDLDFRIMGGNSIAKCNCYSHSKFQWNVIEILEHYNVKYIAEYKIPTLDKYRYDFAIFTDDMQFVRYLIECHGEQHYHPVLKFGGADAYFHQRNTDLEKMEQAKSFGVPLIIIPFTVANDSNYIEEILRSFNIIK